MTKKQVILFFVALYPILPGYFKIVNLDSGVFLAIIFCMINFSFILLENKKISISQKLLVMLALCSMLMLIPLLLHGENNRAIRIIIEYFLTPLFFINGIKRKKDIIDAINVVLYVCCALTFCGVIEFISKKSLFVFLFNGSANDFYPSLQMRGSLARIATTFGHSISFAIYLSACALLAFFMYCRTKKKKYLFIYIMILVNIIMTVARFPIIVFVIFQLIMLWNDGYKNFIKTILKVSIIGVLLVVIGGIIFPKIFETLNAIMLIVGGVFSASAAAKVGDISNANPFIYRFELFKVIPQYFKGHLLFGNGENIGFTFSMLNHKYYSIDNAYLEWILKYGICGFCGNIFFLFSGLPNKYRKKNKENVLCISLIVLYIVNLLSVAQMYEYKFFIVVISMLVAIKKQDLYV